MKNSLLFIATLWPMIGVLGAIVFAKKNEKLRFDLSSLVMAIEFILMVYLVFEAANGNSFDYTLGGFCGNGLHLQLDGFRAMYGTIAVFMWFMTTLFTKEYLHHYENKARYLFFTLVSCGATVGVFLSGNLFTTFIYFEIMSFTSYVMVIHEQTQGALRAGETYIAVAIIGGMVMLMGLFLLYWMTGTLEIDELYALCQQVADQKMLFIAGVLILFGFAAKAGLFPLQIWLPKAHPVAPAPASALLSGILTKAGVFGMFVVSMEIFRENTTWGYLIMVLGVITMLLGAILAIFSNNLKRTLACSSMSQIGFISVGLAMCIFLGHHNALAARGAILHAVNHSLIKLLLFQIAGVVYMNLHQLDLNIVRGFGRKRVLLMVLFLIGALGISGVPLFNGYISKTLIHESILEYVELLEGASPAGFFHLVEILFVTAGGFTAAYMTKLFVCLFVEKNNDPKLQQKYDKIPSIMNTQSTIALLLSAIPLLLIGFVPDVFATGLADFSQEFLHAGTLAEAVHYFSFTNIKGACTSLIIGAVVYLFFIRLFLMKKEGNSTVYVDRWPAWLDLENAVYRPLIAVLVFIGTFIARFFGSFTEWFMALLHLTILKKCEIPQRNPEDYEHGNLISTYHSSDVVYEIESSLSFSLLLFGLGVALALLYILIK